MMFAHLGSSCSGAVHSVMLPVLCNVCKQCDMHSATSAVCAEHSQCYSSLSWPDVSCVFACVQRCADLSGLRYDFATTSFVAISSQACYRVARRFGLEPTSSSVCIHSKLRWHLKVSVLLQVSQLLWTHRGRCFLKLAFQTVEVASYLRLRQHASIRVMIAALSSTSWWIAPTSVQSAFAR